MHVDAKSRQRVTIPFDLTPDKVASLDQFIGSVIKCGVAELVLECAQLTKATSVHIGILWRAYLKAVSTGARVKLVSVGPSLYRILRVLEFDRQMDIDQLLPAAELEDTGRFFRSSTPRSFNSRCSRELESSRMMVRAFRRFIRTLNLSSHDAIDLETVFYEVLTNIRNYAQLKSGDLIEVSAELNRDEIHIVFADPGIEFDPTRPRAEFQITKALKAGQNHGFGLIMIAKMTDNMEYYRYEDGYNVLKLTKKISEETPGA